MLYVPNGFARPDHANDVFVFCRKVSLSSRITSDQAISAVLDASEVSFQLALRHVQRTVTQRSLLQNSHNPSVYNIVYQTTFASQPG